MRHNVIERRTDEMRRLSDDERAALIAAAPNVIGFDRFRPFTARVLRAEMLRVVRVFPGILA